MRSLIHRGARNRVHESGQILIITAVLLPVLLGVGGLALDVSFLYGQRQASQVAADAAAQAGAIALAQGKSPAIAVADATSYAKSDGFTATSVRLIPATDPDEVQVGVSIGVSPILSGIIHPAGFSSSVSATANASRVSESNSNAIWALDPNSDADTILINGNGCLGTTGGMYDDSSSSLAVENPNGKANCPDGKSSIEASSIDVVGGAGSGCCSVTPVPNSPYAPDPLLGLVLPSYSGGNWTSPVSTTPLTTQSCCGATMQPGVYPGGITISNGTHTLSPGIYILDGGGLKLQGGSTVVSGSGVFIFNTNNCFYGSGGCSATSCGQISTTGQESINLASPTSGTYQGVVLAQDRNCTTADQIDGQAADSFEGTIYVPSATLNIAGSGKGGPGTANQIIAYKISVTGNGFGFAPADAAHTPPAAPPSSVLIQ